MSSIVSSISGRTSKRTVSIANNNQNEIPYVRRYSCELYVFLRFLQKSEQYWQSLVKIPNTKYAKLRPLQVALLRTVCQAGRRTDVRRLIFAYCNSFTKAPQNSVITAGVRAEFWNSELLRQRGSTLTNPPTVKPTHAIVFLVFPNLYFLSNNV